jgi:hypothetical protein
VAEGPAASTFVGAVEKLLGTITGRDYLLEHAELLPAVISRVRKGLTAWAGAFTGAELRSFLLKQEALLAAVFKGAVSQGLEDSWWGVVGQLAAEDAAAVRRVLLHGGQLVLCFKRLSRADGLERQRMETLIQCLDAKEDVKELLELLKCEDATKGAGRALQALLGDDGWLPVGQWMKQQDEIVLVQCAIRRNEAADGAEAQIGEGRRRGPQQLFTSDPKRSRTDSGEV